MIRYRYFWADTCSICAAFIWAGIFWEDTGTFWAGKDIICAAFIWGIIEKIQVFWADTGIISADADTVWAALF